MGSSVEKGALKRNEEIILTNDNGEPIPVQSWHQAYWPDGTVKWTGHAISLKQNKKLYLKGTPLKQEEDIQIKESKTGIVIDTGVITCQINKPGLISPSISMDGYVNCKTVSLYAYEKKD